MFSLDSHWELQCSNPEKGSKSEENDPRYQKAGCGPVTSEMTTNAWVYIESKEVECGAERNMQFGSSYIGDQKRLIKLVWTCGV